MINKVTKKQIDDAFDYFMDTGRLEELNSDDVYYIQALLKHIANQQNIKLVFQDEVNHSWYAMSLEAEE